MENTETKRSYLYKDENSDLIYVNNKGNKFLLAEAKSPIENGTYDIIVAFKIYFDQEENINMFTGDPAAWFFGAFFGIDDYLNGNDSSLLESCKDYLNEKE